MPLLHLVHDFHPDVLDAQLVVVGGDFAIPVSLRIQVWLSLIIYENGVSDQARTALDLMRWGNQLLDQFVVRCRLLWVRVELPLLTSSSRVLEIDFSHLHLTYFTDACEVDTRLELHDLLAGD